MQVLLGGGPQLNSTHTHIPKVASLLEILKPPGIMNNNKACLIFLKHLTSTKHYSEHSAESFPLSSMETEMGGLRP